MRKGVKPKLPRNRAAIATERRHPRSRALHRLSAAAIVRLINRADRAVPVAVGRAAGALSAFIEDAESGFLAGGRIIYIGAGTSGRLGVLDAAEAPPTFQVPPGRIIGLIAGGARALRRSSEGLEDDPAGAQRALERLRLSARDSLLGIAAGGTTPYVLGALLYAARLVPGINTGLMTCTPLAKPPGARHLIVLPTGPEVLTGSTRMKAGSATKMALNIVSTTLMVRAGRVYENLMVDLSARNDKLRDRAARIITLLTGISRPRAFRLLARAGGVVKTAVVMQRLGLSRPRAQTLLARHAGRLDLALGEK